MNAMYLKLNDQEADILIAALDSLVYDQEQGEATQGQGRNEKLEKITNIAKGLQVRIERLKKL